VTMKVPGAKVTSWLGRAELLAGALLVLYAGWHAWQTAGRTPEHVSLLWEYAFALSLAIVGIFGFGVAGAALVRGHRLAWRLQLLIPLTLLARWPLVVLMVSASY
jgi:hypothetical protein